MCIGCFLKNPYGYYKLKIPIHVLSYSPHLFLSTSHLSLRGNLNYCVEFLPFSSSLGNLTLVRAQLVYSTPPCHAPNSFKRSCSLGAHFTQHHSITHHSLYLHHVFLSSRLSRCQAVSTRERKIHVPKSTSGSIYLYPLGIYH